MAHALVSVVGTPLRGETDELGRARFDHVPPGPCTVRARLGGFAGRAEGRIQSGKVTWLTVHLAYAAPGDSLPITAGPQVFANVIVLGTRRGAPTDEPIRAFNP